MNKTSTVLLAVGLVVGLALGYFIFGATATLKGANVTPSNALDQQSLTNELNLIANPLVAIEQTSTASLTFPTVNPTTPAATTTNIGIAAALGDEVLVMPNGTSTGSVVYSGTVTTASTTSATVTLNVLAGQTGSSTPNPQTFDVYVLPFASFKAPTGL